MARSTRSGSVKGRCASSEMARGCSSGGREVSLAEALKDPIIRAVMDADGVDARKLAAELRDMAAVLNRFDRPPVMTSEARRCLQDFASPN